MMMMFEQSTTNWGAMQSLIDAEVGSLKPARVQLLSLLDASRQHFKPFQDPLEISLADHRWLKLDREEAYSDWLEWVLCEIGEPNSILRLLDVDLLEQRDEVLRPIKFERERHIDYGHEGHEGRLDLLLRLGSNAVVAIEIKLTAADHPETDLLKQTGYGRWLEKHFPRELKRAVLISKAGKQPEYYGFTHLGWRDLCLRLRCFVPGVIAEGRLLSASLMLCFIAAVEQNVLELSPISQPSGVDRLGSIPTQNTTRHLQATLKMTEARVVSNS
jgi:hypothetical protein